MLLLYIVCIFLFLVCLLLYLSLNFSFCSYLGIPLDVMPSEQLSKLKEEKRIRDVRRKRAGLKEEVAVDPRLAREGPLGGKKGELAETILSEIEERRQHLEDMERLGIKSDNERIIAMEINNRVKELRNLDERAADVYGLPDEQRYDTRNSAPFHRE